MLEKIMDALNFAFRQKEAVYRVGRIASKAFSNGFSFKKIAAIFIAFTEMFGSVLFDGGLTPLGQELNLDGYELVFCDEFDGDSLNTDLWAYRASGPRRGGYNAESQVEVKDGNLVFTGEYLEDGEYGPGWYVGMVNIKQKYKRGYFECRAIINSGDNFWSAFWIQADHPYDHDLSKGGVGGAEIDIFENVSSNANIFKRNSVTHTIHCNGGDDDAENLDSCTLGKFRGNNIYEEYNTYGLEWTEDEYIFYINGVETARSSWSKGVSEVEEMVIVSLEIPEKIEYETTSGHKTQFIVDYVKIWQKPADIQNSNLTVNSGEIL